MNPVSILIVGVALWSASSWADQAKNQSESELVTVSMLTHGDHLGDGKPEALQLKLSAKAVVEAARSATISDPSAFLDAPFLPSAEDQKFVRDLTANLQKLTDATVKSQYQEIAIRLFTQAFAPPGTVTATVSARTGQVLYYHPLLVRDVMGFQKWYFDILAKKATGKIMVTTYDGNPDHPVLPFLLFGTVLRSGKKPNYKIAFDPKDTIITANAQNESYDTTLYQLRTGIYDTAVNRKADIPIVSFTSVQVGPCSGSLTP
jgi:hypothetical protein